MRTRVGLCLEESNLIVQRFDLILKFDDFFGVAFRCLHMSLCEKDRLFVLFRNKATLLVRHSQLDRLFLQLLLELIRSCFACLQVAYFYAKKQQRRIDILTLYEIFQSN